MSEISPDCCMQWISVFIHKIKRAGVHITVFDEVFTSFYSGRK